MHLNPLLGVAIIAAVVSLLVFLIRRDTARGRENNAKLQELWQKLNAEALDVSLLISKHCPANVDAHKLVIAASQCLVFPNVGAHTIVSAGMIEQRYNEGLALLKQARDLAVPKN